MKRAQRLGAFLAALGLLALGSACSGSEGADDPPRAEQSAAASGSGEPSSSPGVDPSAAAASGKAMVTANAYLRAPRGWRIERQLEGVLDAWVATQRGRMNLVYLSDFGTTDAETLRQFVRRDRFPTFRHRPEISYDAELGGEPAYHASGRGSTGPRDTYGALRGGRAVTVTFQLEASLTPAEREQLVDSVLASFRWA